MSIFGKIVSAIFGSSAQAAPGSGSAAPATSAAGGTSAGAVPSLSSVDMAAILDKLADDHAEDLDWKKSIVDLMKLVGLDSSLANRRELAKELGYTGDTKDTATMNMWLHKQVMAKLAANGGNVPKDLLD
jgi:hypothetical protein